MSRVRPILFNGEMVRAILDGRKTVTRRLVKVPNHCPNCMMMHNDFEYDKLANNFYCTRCGEPLYDEEMPSPYRLGDILYVRETWGEGYEDGTYIYKADDKLAELPTFKEASKLIYHPSIHMPKEAARIWLKVTDVRVERLQEITISQAIAEGIPPEEVIPMVLALPNHLEYDMDQIVGDMQEAEQIRLIAESFGKLWNTTVKKPDLDRYGWEASPWVWVIEFERCDRPDGWPG